MIQSKSYIERIKSRKNIYKCYVVGLLILVAFLCFIIHKQDQRIARDSIKIERLVRHVETQELILAKDFDVVAIVR